MFTLGFWLSASCLLDFVIMPSLSLAGMMSANGMMSAAYLMFGIFNRLEVVCAALVLSGFFVFHNRHTLAHLRKNLALVIAAILLVITLLYTYLLTPWMSSLGLSLNFFEATNPMTGVMLPLQMSYWLLEGLKLVLGVTLLRWCYQDSCRLSGEN
jgi:hypothetical protein